PPRTHEFRAGVRVLEALLKPYEGLEVTAVSADGAWKEGPDLIRRADAVVLYVSQGYQWMHQTPERHLALTEMARRGGGIVGLHWAIGCKDAKYIPDGLKLLGGCHGGPDRKYVVTTTELRPVTEPRHPIATGVDPIRVKDEFYYQLKFVKPADGLRPVMRALINGEPETVAWAWERPDGGRSFGFSGLHFHDNWKLPEYRRLVTQAVLWSLKEPIPENGAKVEIPGEVLELK
ncbi:MAG TPA: ThuA domain-containing protein, partial [Gemmataceae bacterium]